MRLRGFPPNAEALKGTPGRKRVEFVAWAKAQGNKLSYGSVGNGSSSHLTMELFKSVAGFEAVHVPTPDRHRRAPRWRPAKRRPSSLSRRPCCR